MQGRTGRCIVARYIKRGRGPVKVHRTDELLGNTIMPDKPHSVVSYGAAFTKGLPNYSSVKIDIHVSMPCANSVEARKTTFLRAKKFTLTRLQRELDSAVASIEEGLV